MGHDLPARLRHTKRRYLSPRPREGPSPKLVHQIKSVEPPFTLVLCQSSQPILGVLLLARTRSTTPPSPVIPLLGHRWSLSYPSTN